MYENLLVFHSLFRWILLLVAIYAIGRAKYGWFFKKPFTERDKKAGTVLTIVADIQLVFGLIIYIFLSPLIKEAFQDFGAAMKNPELRFHAIEHILVMLIAIALFHIGKIRVKKALTDRKKHANAMWFYGIGLLLILSRIPWNVEQLWRWF